MHEIAIYKSNIDIDMTLTSKSTTTFSTNLSTNIQVRKTYERVTFWRSRLNFTVADTAILKIAYLRFVITYYLHRTWQSDRHCPAGSNFGMKGDFRHHRSLLTVMSRDIKICSAHFSVDIISVRNEAAINRNRF